MTLVANNPIVEIDRVWAMPCAETFSIRPIERLLDRWLDDMSVIIDPFARNSSRGTLTNDLNPETAARFHLPVQEFLDTLLADGVVANAVLWDPPYSYRQAVEVYQGVGRCWTKEDQQQVGRWSKAKNIATGLLDVGGIVISFGWNSTGFGKVRGFQLLKMLIVNHGSAHNDTIVTVEQKR